MCNMRRHDDTTLGQLRRDMGLFSAIAVVVGNCIGAGIFITPSIVYKDAGSVGVDILMWIAAGLSALIHGLCITELGTMLPSAGGPYEYVSVGVKTMGRVGDLVSFLFAWSFLVCDPAIVTIHGFTFTSYALSIVYGSCPPPYEVTVLVTVIVIALAAVVNTFSLKTSMNIQNVLFVVKLGVLLAIIGTGAVWCVREPGLFDKVSFTGHTTPGKIVEAFSIAVFTVSGSSMIACMAEEMRNPSWIIPRSLIGGLLLVTGLLVLTNVAYFIVLDHDSATSSEATAATFARISWGVVGEFLMPIIVCVSTFGTMSASFLSNSRLLMAASRKKHLPAIFSLLTVQSSLPVVAIASRLFLAILFTVTGSVGLLAKGCTTIFCVMTSLMMFAMLRLRVTMKDANRPFKVPMVLILLNLSVSLIIIMVPVLTTGDFIQYIVAIACVLLGFPAYVGLKILQRSNTGVKSHNFLQKVLMSVPSVQFEVINRGER